MGIKMLHFLRLLIPGLIIIFEFLPVLDAIKVSYKIGEGWLSYSLLVIPALVIGGIYHLFNVRYTVTSVSHRKIDLNIVTSLYKMYNRTLSQTEYNFLKKKRMKHIFYYFIDKDPSLSARSQIVYFNGLLWTSTADAFILSIFSCIIFFIFGKFLLQNQLSLDYCGLYILIALFAFCLHILSVYNHYRLSNDQLEYIETHYLSELKSKIDDTLLQSKGNETKG